MRWGERCSGWSGRCAARVFPAERSYRRPTRREGVLLKFPFKNPTATPLRWRGLWFDHRSARGAGKRSLGSSSRRRLLSASALPAPSEPASATALCRCQTTWVSLSSPPPTRARTALAAETPRPPAGPPALLTLRKRAQAPTRRKARDSPGNWLFLKGAEPASSTIKRPVYK